MVAVGDVVTVDVANTSAELAGAVLSAGSVIASSRGVLVMKACATTSGVRVAVAVGVKVGVSVDVAVLVSVAVGDEVSVAVAVAVMVGVLVDVGVWVVSVAEIAVTVCG